MVWHDRAVFHFLVDGHDRPRDLEVLRSGRRPGGHIIVATFASDGHRSSAPARRSPATTTPIRKPRGAVADVDDRRLGPAAQRIDQCQRAEGSA